MDQHGIPHVLARLRAAADEVAHAWPSLRWNKLSGPGPESLELDARGTFHGLVLQPNTALTLRCRLHLPAEVAGVSLIGDPLEATVFSIFPVTLSHDESVVLAAADAPVAPGPALIQVLPQMQAGENGDLELTIHVPNNQATPWCSLRFTSPRLRERFELFDVAWAQLAIAHTLAASDEEHALVAAAARLVPEVLLSPASDEMRVRLEHMAQTLLPLASRAEQLRVHLIGHSHIDMNWLWTWSDTVAVIERDFESILQLMAQYPELTFTHSQPATYEVIRRRRPDLFSPILAYIRQGRWEAATAMWVEGDINMASGEALARQFLEGVSYSQHVLDANPSVCLAPDTFGHAGNLPQLAASAGITSYYHHRCNPGGSDYWPAYWWYGQDGTRLLAMSTSTYNGEIRARDLAAAAVAAHRHGLRSSLHFHGIGDHGGGPARHNLDALRRFQQLPLLPNARCSRLDTYATELLASDVALPAWHGESSTIFEGCYTTHADTKRYNRASENMLSTADTLSSLAGLEHEPEMHDAWRSVLFHQFHDILDGSAIRESYAEQADAFASIASTAEQVTERALHVLQRGLPPNRFAVTNPTGMPQQDWVTVAAFADHASPRLIGNHEHDTVGQSTAEGIGFVARVPPLSTVCYELKPHAELRLQDDLSVEPSFAPADRREPNLLSSVAAESPYLKVETPHFQAYVRRDSGIIVSFVDKRVGRQLVGFGLRRATDYIDSARADLGLNVFQLVEEHPHGMSAWHYDEVFAETSLLRGAETEVVESGPARIVLEVRHTLRQSSIRQYIVFYRELPVVDFQTTVDWQETGTAATSIPNLKVAFTCRLPACEAWFETPFAALQRPSDGQEVPALRWAEVGGTEYGFALLNDSKYGYDALGGRLRLTLLRSTYAPDERSDAGVHSIRYRFVPHSGDWRSANIVQQAAGFNQPLLVRSTQPQQPDDADAAGRGWRPTLDGDSSVILAGLKAAHAGRGQIIRLYESSGRRARACLTGLPTNAQLWETTIAEERRREVTVHDGQAELSFMPWQVRTLLVQQVIPEAVGDERGV